MQQLKAIPPRAATNRNTHDEVVSIDRLKPAYIDTTITSDPSSSTINIPASTIPDLCTPSSPSTTTRTTRSGCHIHWPKRFRYIDTEGGVL